MIVLNSCLCHPEHKQDLDYSHTIIIYTIKNLIWRLRMEEKKRKFAVPHTFVILLAVVILVAILSFIMPAGVYDRIQDPNTGRTIVDVTSFHFVENQPVGPWGILKAIPTAMADASSIIFFVLILGGSFTIIEKTGAVNTGMSAAIERLKGHDNIIIPLIMFLMSILGFTIGAAEEVVVFVPIAIMLARGFGYDDVVGVAMVSTGAAVGFSGGMLNPFTTGVAQGIAELPLYSGMGFRIAGYIIFYLIAVWHVMKYANKVKADPKNSVLYGVDRGGSEVKQEDFGEFSTRHKLVLLGFVVGLVVMIYGVMEHDWYITEIAAVFLGSGIICGAIGGLGPSKMATAFIEGAKGILFGALVVGVARTILIVLQQGVILDSIIYFIAKALETLPTQVTAIGMFIANSVINFFIPSGSGQAATMVPIMAPLADVLNITRQTAVLAVTYGDAFSNQIIPTSGALMAVIAMANIPYDKWLKFNWKLVAWWSVAGIVLIGIADTIKLGPF